MKLLILLAFLSSCANLSEVPVKEREEQIPEQGRIR